MYHILKRMKDDGKLVSIYTDEERDSTFMVGYVTALTPEELLIKAISPNGQYDGYMWVRTEDVFRCAVNGRYEEKILKLCSFHLKEETDFTVKGKSEILKELLLFSMQKKKLLEVTTGSQILTGYVMKYSDNVLVIREFDTYGQEKETVYLSMEMVDAIYMDTISCREIERLAGSDVEVSDVCNSDVSDMYHVLECIKEKEQLISVFNDPEENDSFAVGYITELNQEELLLKYYSPQGLYDGYRWMRVEDIFQCGTDGCYEKRVPYFCEAQNDGNIGFAPENDQDILKELFRFSMEKEKLLVFELPSEYITGYIRSYSEELLEIQSIDDSGQEDEHIYLDKEMVSEIQMDTLTCKKMEIWRR